MAKKNRKHKNDLHACMVRLYGRLILWGEDTIEDVPEQFREEVEEWVEENTY